MKKRLFSLLLALTLLLSPSAFALEGEGARCADTLAALGLLDNSAGNPLSEALTGPGLTKPVTELTAVSLLIRLSGADAAQSAPFPGLSGDGAREAGCAVSRGWVDSGSFSPGKTLSANAWFTMVLRFLGYQESIGDFTPDDGAMFARRIGLVSRSYRDELTGADLAESAVDLLSAPFKDGSGTVAEKLLLLGKCPPTALEVLGLSSAGMTARQAADRCMAAVFCLSLYQEKTKPEETGEKASEGEKDEKESAADATGFFVSPDGIAVTCYHTIDKMTSAAATLITGEKYPVESVLWYDKNMDLAVLRVSRTSLEGKVTSRFSYLPLAGAAEARPGDIVYAIGNPLGLGIAIADGILSAVGREVKGYSLPCILSNTDISYGSSGGVLLNVLGHVVAVTSGAYVRGNSMYISVPTDVIVTVLKDADAGMAGKPLSEVAAEMAEKARQEKERPLAPPSPEDEAIGTEAPHTGEKAS